MVRFGRIQYKSANASKRVRPVTVKRVSYGNGGRVHYGRVLLRDEQSILNCSSEIASSVSVRPWAHPPITRSAASSERQVAGEASAFGHYKDWSCSLNTITWRGGLNGYASSASVCDAQLLTANKIARLGSQPEPAILSFIFQILTLDPSVSRIDRPPPERNMLEMKGLVTRGAQAACDFSRTTVQNAAAMDYAFGFPIQYRGPEPNLATRSPGLASWQRSNDDTRTLCIG